MAHAPRERLAKLLDDAESPGAFSAQLLVPADPLQLAVKAAGQIRLPVRAPQARKLCDVARCCSIRSGSSHPSTRPPWWTSRPVTANNGPAPSSAAGWGPGNRGHTRVTRIVWAGSKQCPCSATRCAVQVSPARQRPGACWPPPGAG